MDTTGQEKKNLKDAHIHRVCGTDYLEMTRYLLEKADLKGCIEKKMKDTGKDPFRIGIKPNLVSPVPASEGGTTHPEIVAGIIEYLDEHHLPKPVILEGSWVGDKTSESFEVCGFTALSEKYGVNLLDMQKEKGRKITVHDMELNICQAALDLDFLINVPVLKGHCQTKITCALKNLKGLIPNSEKRRFHGMGLYKPIAYLNAALQQDFIVVDHICGDLDFEDGGNPVVRNCIMAAQDPVLVDSYVCKLLNYTPDDVPYIRIAEDLGVGNTKVTEDTIIHWGEQEAPAPLPSNRKIVHLQDAVEEVESCSACYGYLIPALDQLQQDGLLKEIKEKICIGQGYRGTCGTLGVGNCTSGFLYSCKGCPPLENEIYDFLKKYIQGSK